MILRRWIATKSNLAEAIADKTRYTPVIGLEIHVQLDTKTKLFSRTPTGEAPPNQLVSAFDMAAPGTLPVLNKKAVQHALKLGSLLNCQIPQWSRFDRKHYFYADMPAGYQITQNEHPIAKNGRFGFYVFDENLAPYWKEVEITQLQLEQDSGKTVHVGQQSLIDYNRAGCGLIEVVTSPCIATALEAVCFVQHLRLLLMHHRICQGDLHKGHLRVDANVSLSYDGERGTRTEIKNMNSIRCLHTAINFEISRHFQLLSAGEPVVQETRAADPDGRTVSMRDKEVETDYRFMPEPNLPALKIHTEWLQNAEIELKKEGDPKYVTYREKFGFDPRSALHFTQEPELGEFIDECTKHMSNTPAEDVVFWLKELKTVMQRSKQTYPPKSPEFIRQFITIVQFYSQKRLTRLTTLELLRILSLTEEQRDVLQLVEDENMYRINNQDVINTLVLKVLKNNQKLVEKCASGHAKSFNKLRNLVVDESQKRIELVDVENCIKSLLGK